jgi:hypothetical protein
MSPTKESRREVLTSSLKWYTSSLFSFKSGEPHARRDSQKVFDSAGLELLASSNFPKETIDD